jgi:hypothetical protein
LWPGVLVPITDECRRDSCAAASAHRRRPKVPGSTYAFVPQALTDAYELNEKRGLVDNEIDLEGREKPKFGHHGNRRRADKTARDTQQITQVSDGQIDDHFGWNQKERKKQSQLHYHGRDDRMKRARVTMML